MAGEALPSSTSSAFAVFHVEMEFVLPISGIQGRRGDGAGGSEKGRRHLGPIGQDDGQLVVSGQAARTERRACLGTQCAKEAIGHDIPLRRQYGGGVDGLGSKQGSQDHDASHAQLGGRRQRRVIEGLPFIR